MKPTLRTRKETLVTVQDWDAFVMEVYGRPYSFQQQDDCKNRGTHRLEVPCRDAVIDYPCDTVPEVVNHSDMGVSFAAWLARDPEQRLSNPKEQEDYCLELWWYRNFYPSVEMVANDLHSKDLLEAGNYIIKIDW